MSPSPSSSRFWWLTAAVILGLIFIILLVMAILSAANDRTSGVATVTPAPVSTDTPASQSLQPTVTILQGDDRPPQLKRLTDGWNTDWTRHTIRYDEILSGGPPRDGIPAIDAPRFISPEAASAWLDDREPVVALEVNGEARAYPLQILTWHEIVNDEIAGTPVAVTFCPLCNSAVVFDRRHNGQTLDFGVSGLLRNSDLIMYDRQTESLWQQFTGEGIVGEMAGEMLAWLPASIISFEDFRATWPQGQVLSRDTGYNRSYGRNPYVGYDNIDQSPFLFEDIPDDRLPPMARVVTVSLNGEDVAYPYAVLEQQRVVQDQVGTQELVIFFQPGTVSALDARSIADSKDVGATGVFDPKLDGQTLTFSWRDGGFVDDQTGSQWNILGLATAGPLAGQRLTPILHADHFWFSWAAFRPDTRIYAP